LFVQDDDLLVQECLFNTVHGHYLFDNDKLYGVFGRKVNVLGTYSTDKLEYDNPDFVLTRFACFDRRLIPYILESEEKVLPFRFPTARQFPYDDILLSYTAKGLYDKAPFVVKADRGDIEELPAEGGLHEQDDYMELRKHIISRCKEKLFNERIQIPESVA
jgi:hypothetical protein